MDILLNIFVPLMVLMTVTSAQNDTTQQPLETNQQRSDDHPQLVDLDDPPLAVTEFNIEEDDDTNQTAILSESDPLEMLAMMTMMRRSDDQNDGPTFLLTSRPIRETLLKRSPSKKTRSSRLVSYRKTYKPPPINSLKETLKKEVVVEGKDEGLSSSISASIEDDEQAILLNLNTLGNYGMKIGVTTVAPMVTNVTKIPTKYSAVRKNKSRIVTEKDIYDINWSAEGGNSTELDEFVRNKSSSTEGIPEIFFLPVEEHRKVEILNQTIKDEDETVELGDENLLIPDQAQDDSHHVPIVTLSADLPNPPEALIAEPLAYLMTDQQTSSSKEQSEVDVKLAENPVNVQTAVYLPPEVQNPFPVVLASGPSVSYANYQPPLPAFHNGPIFEPIFHQIQASQPAPTAPSVVPIPASVPIGPIKSFANKPPLQIPPVLVGGNKLVVNHGQQPFLLPPFKLTSSQGNPSKAKHYVPSYRALRPFVFTSPSSLSMLSKKRQIICAERKKRGIYDPSCGPALPTPTSPNTITASASNTNNNYYIGMVPPPMIFIKPSQPIYYQNHIAPPTGAENDSEKGTKKARKARQNFHEGTIRLEYGFKPPLVPSQEIDELGNPIERHKF